MKTITIQKSVLSDLVTEILFTEYDIDLFFSQNAKILRFSPEYYEAKSRFKVVIRKIKNMIEK